MKIFKVIKKHKFLSFFVFLLLIYWALWLFDYSNPNQSFGITFSETYAKSLGLDSKKVYLDILNELKVKKLRLVAYWNLIETQKNNFNFDYLDFQIKEAEKRNAEVVLAVGYRVPRWPECHLPEWTKNLPPEDFEKELLNYLKIIIERYKNSPTIKIWQVENEPFLTVFGNCPAPNKNLFEKELSYVKNLDPSRPILITDSGELSFWLNTSGKSEIFGTTLYRFVWNKYTGFMKHYFPPFFYTLRAWLVEKFSPTKKVIIAELQAEPWIPNSSYSLNDQAKIFSVQNLKNNINFAKKTGLSEIYLWGAEWWYAQKLNNHPEYWEEIKKLNF
ncbi:MAG: beta-galactosidase [Minisyncoccia bacterium]